MTHTFVAYTGSTGFTYTFTAWKDEAKTIAYDLTAEVATIEIIFTKPRNKGSIPLTLGTITTANGNTFHYDDPTNSLNIQGYWGASPILVLFDGTRVPLGTVDIPIGQTPSPATVTTPATLLAHLSAIGTIKELYTSEEQTDGPLPTWNGQMGAFPLTAVGAAPFVTIDAYGRKVVNFGSSNLVNERMTNDTMTVNSQDHTVMVVTSSYGFDAIQVGATFDTATDAFRGGVGFSSHLMFTRDNATQSSSLRATSGITFMGLRATATEATLYNEDDEDIGAVLISDTYDGINVGSWGSGTASDPNLYAVVVFDSALTDAEFKAARTVLLNYYNILSQSKVMVFQGDSITEGTDSTKNRNYPFYMQLPGYKLFNAGVGGDKWANLIADFPAISALYYDATKSKNIIIGFAGTSDISAATSPADTFALSETWVALAQAEGWTVVIITMLPRTNVSNVDRNAYCDLLLGSSADLVVDVRDSPVLGYDGADLVTHLFDVGGVHPNSHGYKILAELVQSKIQAIL